MMRFISYICLSCLLLVGCTDEDLVKIDKAGNEQVLVDLNFGHTEFEQIKIEARSTLGEIPESRILDIYAFLCVNGNVVYHQHFNESNKQTSASNVTSATSDCWYVQNRTLENGDCTQGTIRMKLPTVSAGTDGKGGIIYLIANADRYTVTIAPEILANISTEEQLKALTATLNGEVITRYGYFPMVANVDDVTVNKANGLMSGGNTNITTYFKRLDAKVNVNVGISTDSYTSGDGTTIQIEDFTPESWCLMNVPLGTYVLENSGGDDGVTGYFNTPELAFESAENGVHSFSFYMLENRYVVTEDDTDNADGIFQGKKIPSDATTPYHLRDLRKKITDKSSPYYGQYTTNSGDMWEYAPEKATYMILKGHLSMKSTGSNGTVMDMGTDVTYYIHLGDFRTNVNNYSVERNTSYTYTITIKGVEAIEVEVKTSDMESEFEEQQSGATGNIYKTKEDIKLVDAHYSQFVYCIDADDLDEDEMSWRVETPFSEGAPNLDVPGFEAELPNYDYKWVWFLINAKGDTKGKKYPGNKCRTGGDENWIKGKGHLMDVNEFVLYVREQRELYLAKEESIFDETDGKVYVNVYIDEYYYQKHPTLQETPNDFWKDFVNQSPRVMHILCGSKQSYDQESSSTNSIITIRQRSIQTAYNKDKAELHNGWGTESVDEGAILNWFYDENNTRPPSSGSASTLGSQHSTSSYNTSRDNGLYNTALLMGLMTASSNEGTGTYSGLKLWETFINYNTLAVDGEMAHALNSGYQGLLYGTLLRNRDNDGDGQIDADELRWYVGSLGQLCGIFIGQLGFRDKTAYLYDKEQALAEGLSNDPNKSHKYEPEYFQPWRNHIVTSTKSSHNNAGNRTTVVWSEEGMSTSYYLQENDHWGQSDWGKFSIRCVRNLGMDSFGDQAKTDIEDPTHMPTDLIDYKIEDQNGNSKTTATTITDVYVFDLTNVNEVSLRSDISLLELWPSNEFEYNARPYKRFMTYPGIVTVASSNYNFPNQFSYLQGFLKGESSSSSYTGVEGYRVPNIREAALMHVYCTDKAWWGNSQTMVGTSYYRSDEGKISGRPSWCFGYGYASLQADGALSLAVRPVKDVE